MLSENKFLDKKDKTKQMKKIKVGSDFSGVGAFNQALMRLGIDYEEIFACDMDKYARQTFIHNYGEPKYYPMNVYDREIPEESLDIYMTSPPCQAFSSAGKRLGKEDKRGILFFNSLEFIEKNRPRFFIFENVKGLLSDDGGRTFQEWVNLLGGKSVNGLPVLFPYEESVPYHLYWQVLNAKHHGVPQNRERVFLIGIRDDFDNKFQFPKEEHLIKRLKDILEEEIIQKFYLSDAAMEKCLNSEAKKDILIKEVSDVSKCIVPGYYKIPFDGQYLKVKSNLDKYYLSDKMLELLTFKKKGNYEVANINKGGQMGIVEDVNAPAISCLTAVDYKNPKKIIQVNSVPSNGYYIKVESNLEKYFLSEKMINGFLAHNKRHIEEKGQDGFNWKPKDLNQIANCLRANAALCATDNSIMIQKLNSECNQAMIIDDTNLGFSKNPIIYDSFSPTLRSERFGLKTINNQYKIRRLTPRECFRLMDFPDTFTWPVSDSQAYKQAGNSIVVNVLYKILKNLSI